MKKIWPIVLLGILLLCISCVKEEVAETDLIFEGKTYVIGSGKPPKGQPMKMLIKESYMYNGVKLYKTVDSFYTDNRGYFRHKFHPNLSAKFYLVMPETKWMYDNLDIFFPKKLGIHKRDFRIRASGILRLRIKNANYNWGDSLVITDLAKIIGIFSGPFAYDHTYDFHLDSFESLLFEYILFRNGERTNWNESYMVYDDSIHYHEIIY